MNELKATSQIAANAPDMHYLKKLAWTLGVLAASIVPLSVPAAAADGAKTSLTWYGQSAFRIMTPQGHVLYIDPWIANPKNAAGEADLAAISRADLVLVSHGHFDHVGQTARIVKQTGAHVVASLELGDALVKYAGVPQSATGYDSLGNAGGTLSYFGGEVRITFVPAIHSSSINAKALKTSSDGEDHYAGNPTGFIIAIRNGPVFYHTGDTAEFADMSQLRKYHVTVMLTCIGDHFTMGPADAAKAVKLVAPKVAIPMHYGTLPVLTGTPEAFERALTRMNVDTEVKVQQIHQTLTF